MNKNYQKIIIRNKSIRPEEIRSRFILLNEGNEFSNISDLLSHYDITYIMKDILLENDFESHSLESSDLYKKYLEVKKTNKSNDYFSIIYRVYNDIGIKLEKHMYLYKLLDDLQVKGNDLLPWYYASEKKYLADVWWESDEEIIKDLYELPFIEFIIKYKALV